MRERVVPKMAIVAAVVVLAGCGGSNDSGSAAESGATTAPVATTSPTETRPVSKPTTITIRVVGGRPEGGIARPSVKKNDPRCACRQVGYG